MAKLDGPKHAKIHLPIKFLWKVYNTVTPCAWRLCNGQIRWPKTRKNSFAYKIPMESVQYNTEHYEMNDDTDDEHSV